jgi:MFS family permease
MVASSVAFGGVSSLISEWFPARVRTSGISIAYQISGALGGGAAPVVATWLYTLGDPNYLWVAAFLAAMSLVSLLCVLGFRGMHYLSDDEDPAHADAKPTQTVT